jgi:hypothetical protein
MRTLKRQDSSSAACRAPSGSAAGQQIWLGPAMTGRIVPLWAGLDRVHVLLDGFRVRPCRPGSMPATCRRVGLEDLSARPDHPGRGRWRETVILRA